MRHRPFLIFVLFSWFFSAQDIQLSNEAEISVLTCGPGDVLYTAFGHSAFRVKDPNYPFDIVYNYGTFDFDTPGFYNKFARGKLLYQLSRSRFERFMAMYNYEERWVKEQVLSLTPQQKQAIFDFLENNARPENRDYLYDFFFENCATKMWDVMEQSSTNAIAFNEAYTEPMTFREALQEYLHFNSWGSFGIDLALGAVTDREASPKELMYLPDYVFEAFDSAANHEKSLVKSYSVLLSKPTRDFSTNFFISPLFFLLLILGFVLWRTYRDYKTNQRSKWLDFGLFFITGLAGVILCFLWFATDHTATHRNFNTLWAFAPNLVLSFILLRKNLPNWIGPYLLGLIMLLFLGLLLWMLGVQSFAPILVVLLVALLFRYGFLYRHVKAL